VAKASRLLAPDVARMAVIEQQLAANTVGAKPGNDP
jgi:hypothetical protein